MKKAKYIIAFVLAIVTLFISIIPASAATAGTAVWYKPDGGTVYETIPTGDVDLNRTIYIYKRDTAGNLLKYYVCKTGVLGEYDCFSTHLLGYDLVGFSSNKGLGENCYLTKMSHNDTEGASTQFGYEFYWLISKNSLTLNLTYDRHDPTLFEIKHYLIGPGGTRTLYAISTESHRYGDSINIKRKYISGYSLDEEYASAVNGTFTYDMWKTFENMGGVTGVYQKDSHDGKLYDRYSYTESSTDHLSYTSDRHVYVTFKYNLNSYTVKFDANGGYGAPSEITKYYNQTTTLPATEPFRPGYTFNGWSLVKTGTTAKYQAGSSYSDNTSRTLYALWESNTPSEYTVSYYANGGSGAPASQTKKENIDLYLSSLELTRSGYTFLGWSESSTATTATYQPGGIYTDNADMKLYAVWKENAVQNYTVSYDANGGTGAPINQIKIHGVELTLSSTIPTRIGYTFLGWSSDNAATDVQYNSGDKYTKDTSVTLYAVWEQNAPEIYTVRYNANGGADAPASQEKTEGVDLILSDQKPTWNGYDFLGWSEDSTATSAVYAPGDMYSDNKNATLYAVWEKSNYDFSVSLMSVSESEVYRNGEITVKVRLDSWDKVNAYSDIPFELLYDGKVISQQYVDFKAYGVANLTFTVNVGDSAGDKSIEARVNWDDHENETRTWNNNKTSTVNVKDYNYEMSVDPVIPNADYTEGTEVITSFTVNNDSDYDIIPSNLNTARFSAYYYSGTKKIVISSQDWENVVIPSKGTNLVYFKWKVPEGLKGKTVYCECTVNADFSLGEENMTNNTASFSSVISSVSESQTPNTRFESQAPNSYQNVSAPSENTDSATWTVWEYENGSFVLKKYGVQISSASPSVAPNSDCTTAVYKNGKWTMRSGYGITISYISNISTVSGYNCPNSNAYTGVQSVVATFPEFRYYDTYGNCRTLEYADGSFSFAQNSDADGEARVHFIPLYVNDGSYTVSVTATQVWTPVGMIEATRNANDIIIDGTIYDDWYQG